MQYEIIDKNLEGPNIFSHLAKCVFSATVILQILTEVAGESLAQMTAAPKTRIAQQQQQQPAKEESDEEEDDLAARLQAIRS